MLTTRVGSADHTWQTELRDMWGPNHRKTTLALMDDILANGITTPIHIGDDGRLWDGHHRIAVAIALGIDSIPVYSENLHPQ